MIDWASSDPILGHGDVLHIPPPESDAGIYLLEEAERATPRCDPSRPPYERGGSMSRRRSGLPDGYREGFTNGYRRENNNAIPCRTGLRSVYDVAWDERPLHFAPGAGAEWAHLVPPARCGPPAFPVLSQSEGANNPDKMQLNGRCCDKFAVGGTVPPPPPSNNSMAIIFVLVLLVAVLLAMMGRVTSSCEKTLKRAIKALAAKQRDGPPA